MRSFFFYDLETSGFNKSADRIMQFAGQRTDENLKPIGEPINLLVKLSDDILPSPGAIMVTKITPQETLRDGITEPEFCRFFIEEVTKPNTIILGYNSVRFDDEFIRHTLWRNFRDPYTWSYSDNCSRWDMLDVTRMVRALRPDGINWPNKRVLDKKTGQEKTIGTVNLVDMSNSNGFTNKHAHDALADVFALIDLTKLIKAKQPKMWRYLLKIRNKSEILKIIKPGTLEPFVYTSGRYPSDNEKTTIATIIGHGKLSTKFLAWDLRYSVEEFSDIADKDLAKSLPFNRTPSQSDDAKILPIKEIAINRCPAVAPIGVVDKPSEKRLHINLAQIQANLKSLKDNAKFIKKVIKAYCDQPEFQKETSDVEAQLYDSFTPDSDKNKIRLVAGAKANELADLQPEFHDYRLSELLLRYKARNYPQSLSADEQTSWEKYRTNKLRRELPSYLEALTEAQKAGADEFLLQELQLWAESIMPFDIEG